MASSDTCTWVFGVQLQSYSLIAQVEYRNGQFCCCDTWDENASCVTTLQDIHSIDCMSKCDPYFEIYFEINSFTGPSLHKMMRQDVLFDSLAVSIFPLVFQPSSDKAMLENISHVSESGVYTCIFVFSMLHK